MEDTTGVVISKPFVPWFCHGLSLVAHVLLLGGAALLRPVFSVQETSIEEHLARARMLVVAAMPEETVTEERGGERKVSGPREEGTMEPVRDDARPATSTGERAEARKTETNYADDVPSGMWGPYTFDLGTTPTSWFDGMGTGSGGKRDAEVDRGDRLDAAAPAARPESKDITSTSLAGGTSKPWFCPPAQPGENAVFCRRPFLQTR